MDHIHKLQFFELLPELKIVWHGSQKVLNMEPTIFKTVTGLSIWGARKRTSHTWILIKDILTKDLVKSSVMKSCSKMFEIPLFLLGISPLHYLCTKHDSHYCYT